MKEEVQTGSEWPAAERPCHGMLISSLKGGQPSACLEWSFWCYCHHCPMFQNCQSKMRSQLFFFLTEELFPLCNFTIEALQKLEHVRPLAETLL